MRLRSLGDAVLCTVLTQAIAKQRPDLEIALALEPSFAPLFADQPSIHDVITVKRGLLGRISGLREIRRRAFDVAIDLHGGPTAALLTRWSGAPVRVGLEAFRQGRAYDVKLASPFKGAERKKTLHTVESNREVARSLGLDQVEAAPRLEVTAGARARAVELLTGLGIGSGEPFTLMHPGAALPSKTWPWQRFSEVASRLANNGTRILVARSPGVDPPELPAGAVALPEVGPDLLLAVIARGSAFLGNDSGPAHMAAAVGVPTVTIFGSQDPRVWRPWGSHHIALSARLDCSPCRGFTCDNEERFACLTRVSVDDVVAAMARVRAANHGQV